jgi:hypothetical protein
MSRYLRLWHLVLVLAVLGMLTACSSAPGVAATPTKTPVALIAANQGPTVTPAPFFTPTAEAVINVGPDNFPSNVNPLTGLTVSDPTVLDRRPLAVVISNSPPDDTRPQAGLSYADIVYEHFTEGHVTRYAPIFYSNAPEAVGSVRSCRLIMLEITLMYDALWTCSGSSTGVGERLLESPNRQLLINGQYYAEPYLRRVFDSDIAVVPEAPHNLFAVPAEIWAWADEKGYNARPNLDGMAFHSQPPAGGGVATRVTIDYRGAGFTWVWEYDAASGTYLRYDGSAPYLDNWTDEQLRFDNVIVVTAVEYITDIVEDASGAMALEQQIWGEGDMTLFRDGMRYDGKWRRPTGDDMLTFYDLNGNVMPLRPGKTWVQVLDLRPDRLTVEP